MTWFAWRQFRTPARVTAAGLAAVAALLAWTGRILADQWASSGAATCHLQCGTAYDNFIQQVTSSANDHTYQYLLFLVYVVPPLIGIFWGAPLIARELEAGTHRLTWTQSVTRTRWIATKLAVVGGTTAAAVGLLSWGATTWSQHIDTLKYSRVTPLIYGARGIVPVGYALFAFTLGVTTGMLIRRTVPAMATTLAIYIGAVLAMPLAVRSHLAPLAHATPPLDISTIQGFEIQGAGVMSVVGGASPANGWVLSNATITPAGNVFVGPVNPTYCSPTVGPQTCLHWIGTLGLRQDITYQPTSHFWTMQWAETGIFVVAAALLASFCFWFTRSRLT